MPIIYSNDLVTGSRVGAVYTIYPTTASIWGCYCIMDFVLSLGGGIRLSILDTRKI